MAKKKPRTLDVGPAGEVRLPEDVLLALGIEPGGKVEIRIDTRRKALLVERFVDDPWAEAMKSKPGKGFDDVFKEQTEREREAERIWEEKLKNPPSGKRRPEDNPDLWR